MAERNTKKPRTRFKTGVSILIAAVTVAGAFITWRISAAGGKAEAADAQGLTAALNSANTAIAVSTYLSNNLNFYISYRQHLAAADLLEKQARVSGGAKRSSLIEAARRERNMAATSRGYVDADYLEFDPSDGREYFNGNRYWEAQMASERALKPLDEKPFFESADRMRKKARKLVDVTIALSVALFLFVAATAARRRVKYLFAAAATLVFLLSCTAAVMIEISR
jgi:hypothetical protein